MYTIYIVQKRVTIYVSCMNNGNMQLSSVASNYVSQNVVVITIVYYMLLLS